MKISLLILSAMLSASSWASCLQDVVKSFDRLENKVTPLSVWTDEQFLKGTYLQTLKTRWGMNTHIQGVVRIPGTTTFALTGGDIYTQKGSLFIVDFGSQQGKELLEKNFEGKNTKHASLEDKFILNQATGTSKFWHAGGIGILDRLLVVPVEAKDIAAASKLLFYDVTDPHNPKKLPLEINRDGTTTGSILITRNAENKIVLGANVDGAMEFYTSKTEDILDGFEEETKTIHTASKGQGTHIVEQCDGKKFIIDFDNTSPIAPVIWGKDQVRLFSLDLSAGEAKLISMKHVKTDRFCNFKAAGSHYITESGKLAIYGTHFYRHGGGTRFKMCQFAEP